MEIRNIMVQELEKSTKRFVEFMNQYSDQLHLQPSADQWNMYQVVEHVILTDTLIFNSIRQPLNEFKNGHYTKYRIRDLLLNRHQKLKSKQKLEPGKDQTKSIADLLDQFKKVRSHIIDSVTDGKLDLDSEEAAPHSTLGLLTRRDWLYLICFHSDRHIAQTQELLFCH